MFFSGRRHAGENLKDVLAERAAELAPPIQMCDALSRNLPAELETIVAHCLAHGRRQFVEVAEHFPQKCRHVLEALAVIYRNDAIARKRNLSPQSRLEFHQAESGPTMEALRAWLARQFDQRLVEPNSGLGGAIAYILKHWERLTLFLRVPGAPLDNNLCERALKRAILHRKNALFYKTAHGAHVGDLFMSLIYTCELGGANPFDYLTELERHVRDLAFAHSHAESRGFPRARIDGLSARERRGGVGRGRWCVVGLKNLQKGASGSSFGEPLCSWLWEPFCPWFCSKIQEWTRSATLATNGRSSRPKLVESFHGLPSR